MKFKRIIFITFILGLLWQSIFIAHSQSPTSRECNNKDWYKTQNGGFSIRNENDNAYCPNGLGFPVFNAYKDYPALHYRLSGDERKFSYISKIDISTEDILVNYSHLLTLNKNESAKLYVYMHNNGSPSRNRTGESIAKNVKIKVAGFIREADGNYYLKPNAANNIANIQTTISADNTFPKERVHNVKVRLEPNTKLQLRLDKPGTFHRTPCYASDGDACTNPDPERFNALNLITNGLSIKNGDRGLQGEFYGSEGYRAYLHAFFSVVDDTPVETVCRTLRLTQMNVNEEYPSPAVYRYTINPENDQLYHSMQYRFTHQNLGNVGNPQVIVNPNLKLITISNWRDGHKIQFEVRSPDGSVANGCRQLIEFPGGACQSLQITDSQINWENRTARVMFNVKVNLPAAEVQRRFNLTNQAFKATPTNSLRFGERVSSGRIGRNDYNYQVVVHNVGNDKKMSVVLPGYEHVNACKDELTFTEEPPDEPPPPEKRRACESFDLRYTEENGNYIFEVHNIRPANLNAEVIWTFTDRNGTLLRNPLQRNIKTKLALPILGNMPGTRVDVRLAPEFQAIQQNDCQKALVIPERQGACENISISPRTATVGEQATFSLTDIQPRRLFGLAIWQVSNSNGQIRETSDPISIQRSYTTTNRLNAGDTIAVHYEYPLGTKHNRCEDKIHITEELDDPPPPPPRDEPEVCTSLTVADYYSPRTRVTTLPTPGNFIRVNAITTPGRYASLIRTTSTPNILVYKHTDSSYFIFNNQTTSQSSSLRFFVPNEPRCQATLTQSSRDFGFKLHLKKEIPEGKASVSNGPKNYIFANIQQPITYKLTLTSSNRNGLEALNDLATSRQLAISLEDPIISGITGQRRGPNSIIPVNNAKLRSPAPLLPVNLINLLKGYTYTGQIEWDSRVADCDKFTGDCAVQFINTAKINFNFANITPSISVQSNPTYAINLCPFILSRGFGEVFIEDSIKGANVASCGLRNTESPVFKKAEAEDVTLPTTGGGIQVTSPTHGICSQKTGQEDSNFSSASCETSILNSERWQKEQINSRLKTVLDRLSGSAESDTLLSTILDNLGGRNRIAKYNTLTIDNNNDVTIEGNSARTIYVAGDITINSNIKYSNTSQGTVAFVAIGGDIIIKPGVTELNGIFVSIPENNNGGSIKWADEDNDIKPIVIKGSAYGNINDLISKSASGNLGSDRGGVTVIFDGRITRRIPPGLQDVIKFNQFQTANQSSFFSTN